MNGQVEIAPRRTLTSIRVCGTFIIHVLQPTNRSKHERPLIPSRGRYTTTTASDTVGCSDWDRETLRRVRVFILLKVILGPRMSSTFPLVVPISILAVILFLIGPRTPKFFQFPLSISATVGSLSVSLKLRRRVLKHSYLSESKRGRRWKAECICVCVSVCVCVWQRESVSVCVCLSVWVSEWASESRYWARPA